MESRCQLRFRQNETEEGVVSNYSPPFQRRGARAIKTLESEGGVVNKKSRSLPTNAREAHLILLEVTNHPVCAAEEGDHFIEGAATPPLKRRGMSLRQELSQNAPKLIWTVLPDTRGE